MPMNWSFLKRSVLISLVVGSILNVINQGTDILSGAGVHWGHLVMNYLVPFLVASYSAWANEKTHDHDSDSTSGTG